jgi:hypothetical protein
MFPLHFHNFYWTSSKGHTGKKPSVVPDVRGLKRGEAVPPTAGPGTRIEWKIYTADAKREGRCSWCGRLSAQAGAYVLVNNRARGNAPLTVEALTEML